ncbi:MAG TPA: VOC family protein [Streptosporangiaceae bacterium]|jgi:hypothetical protein|nr:VOC family protein [Streptosporangiaceae bacterium]
MSIARFKDLCLDATDPVRLGLFWAEVLGLTWQAQEGGDWVLSGAEYCAFARQELPADRLHGLVVDAADPAALAHWWGRVYGAPVENHHDGHSIVHQVPGMPILTMDFNLVPEPKTVKNRVHWDVSVPAVQPLIDAGATLLRPPGEDYWHVLADPEGNEFCAFTD